jgi:hypothetical protein
VKKQLIFKLVVFSLSLGLSLFAVELLLHVLGVPPEQESHQQLFVEFDSIRGWRNKANSSGRLVSDEYVRQIEYNERSMRGPVLPYEKPAGTFRVLLLGDSFVDGYTEDVGDRVSEVLQRELRAGMLSEVDVIAMGTGGYSTDQELLWLESEGLRYKPDVVVLMFHPNDVWYNGRNQYWRGHKPRFDLKDRELILTNVPVPPPGATPVASSATQRTNQWVRDNSKLYWLLARAVQNQPRLYGLSVRLGLTEPSPEMVFDARRGAVVAGEFSVFSVDPPDQTMLAWRVTRELVWRMRERVQQNGGEFLTFLIPIRSRIYTQDDDVRLGLAAGNAEIDVNAVVRQFHELCITHRLPYIDPTDAYLVAADSLRQSRQRLYYRYDWHWNARGHELAGKLLARYVQPLLTERRARGESGGFAEYIRRTCGAMQPPAKLSFP